MRMRGALIFLAVLAALAAAAPVDAASLDPTFGTDGRVLIQFGTTTGAIAGDMAIQPDGKIVAVGWIGGAFGVVRLLPTGALDPGFGNGGIVLPKFGTDTTGRTPPALALQPDGAIVVAGPGHDPYALGGSDFALMRLKPDGSLDPDFGQGGKAVFQVGVGSEIAEDVAIQPDGKIVVGGYGYQTSAPNSDFVVIRLTPHGRFDTGFGSDGVAFVPTRPDSGMDSASALALAPGGKILLAGASARPDTGFDFAAVRLTADGQPDASFGDQGRVLLPIGSGAWQEIVKSALAQPDGSFYIGGAALQPGFGPSQVALARFGSDGEPDPTFARGGQFVHALGTREDTSSGIVVDGATTFVGVDSLDAVGRRIGVIALDTAGRLDPSFGDGGVLLFHTLTDADEHVAALARRADGALVEFATVHPSGAVNDSLGFAVVVPRSQHAIEPPPAPSDDTPAPVVVIAPKSAIAWPRPNAKLRTVTALRGSASGSFGVDSVDVALVRVTAAKCWYLLSTRPAFRKRAAHKGKCSALAWRRATGAGSWRLTLKRRLPVGRYVLYSRASVQGMTEAIGKPGARNRVAFTVR